MPPRNMRGGKAYKKKKKPVEGDAGIAGAAAVRFEGAEEGDQDYGRVIRMLGDRRVSCFCNDGQERICKIRQALCKGPKRKKIEVGDIVLLSFRDFENHADSDRKEIADLIDKYAHSQWREIRRQPKIHAHLFVSEALATPSAEGDVNDIFEREGDAPASSSDSGSEESSSDEEEINIDAI